MLNVGQITFELDQSSGGGISPILLSDVVSWPGSLFSWVLIILAAGCTLSLIYLAKLRLGVLARFAFQIAALINLIFQWPAALTSEAISRTLANAIWYQGTLVFIELILILWLILTRSLSIQFKRNQKLELPRGTLLMPLALLSVFLIIYFGTVPATCTGFFAFVADPRMTALAREISINLVPSGLVTTVLNLSINVLVPIISAISVGHALINFRSKRFFRFVLWIVFALLVATISLLPGIKGLIIPAAVLISVCLFFWVKKISLGLIFAIGILTMAGVAVISFDTLSERNNQISPYQFSKCASTIEAEMEAERILTAVADKGGYGRTAKEIRTLLSIGVIENSQNSQNSQNSEIPQTDPGLSRYFAFAQGVLNRSFIVPNNVAVLHFKYVEDFGSPGTDAFPLAQKITGSSIDVPNKVFRSYISAASSNSNQEVSGTAPTSSAIAWTAYFGPIGLGTALAVILGIDLFIGFCRRKSSLSLQPLIVGLSMTGALLFISSDFFTALVSHGFLFALIIIGFWSQWTGVDIWGKLRGTGPMLIKNKDEAQSIR